MSDKPWESKQSAFSGSPITASLNAAFRLLWVIEKMWMLIVPALCLVSSATVYHRTKSLLYSTLSTVMCGTIWYTSRYYFLGRVPKFLTPQFKECTSVVRILIHNINTRLIRKYSYRYPLIVNLGLLTRYQKCRVFARDMVTKIEPETLADLSRYIDFAAASYGVLFYPSHVKSVFQRIFTTTSFTSFHTSVSKDVISKMTGIPPDSIIVTQLKGENPLRPGYYICVDKESQSVLLVIRGTLTLSDSLTDITCLSTEFLGGFAHHGISASAVAIFRETKGILERLLEEHNGYRLVITGHSLGGGTASLLTLYLAHHRADLPEYLGKCDLRCFAFAPPPVYKPGEGEQLDTSGIVTVVTAQDIVPRASMANTFSLLMQLQYTENLPLSLWERCALIIDKDSSKLRALYCDMDKMLVEKRGDQEFTMLSHIGRVLWIDRGKDEEGQDIPLLLRPTNTEWETLYFGPRFIADHWPHEYQKNLKLFASHFL
eukprot:sb/3464207/